MDKPEIAETIPDPVHSIRFVLAGDYDELEPRVCAAGFTDSLFARRDGKNYLVVDRGDPKVVRAHAVVTDCLDALRQAAVEVSAIEVYDLNDTVTASYHEACDLAEEWVANELDGLEPHSKINLLVERYEMHLEDYLEAYSWSN